MILIQIADGNMRPHQYRSDEGYRLRREWVADELVNGSIKTITCFSEEMNAWDVWVLRDPSNKRIDFCEFLSVIIGRHDMEIIELEEYLDRQFK